jgi:transposase
MGAKKDFTKEEKAVVAALMGQGLAFREMAEIANRSASAVHRCIKRITDGVETV